MNLRLATVSGMAIASALTIAIAAPSAVQAGGSLKDTYEPVPVAVWAGCYFGGNVGGAWEDDGEVKKFWAKHGDDTHEVTDYEYDEDDDASFIGGVHAGCNWQDGDAVYGVEGDLGFGDNIDYLASLRGRLGWALDDLLLYLTAGVGFLGADDDFNLSHHSHDWSFEDDTNDVGLVVGGGLERKLDPNWSVGLEGLYYFFGDEDSEYEWACKCGRDEKHAHYLDREKDNDIFVVRARLTYHLWEMEEPLPPSYK